MYVDCTYLMCTYLRLSIFGSYKKMNHGMLCHIKDKKNKSVFKYFHLLIKIKVFANGYNVCIWNPVKHV